MDKEELEKGAEKALDDSKSGSGSGKEEAAEKWAPSMDWLMESLGPFFNNNRGLGELLLGKLNETGIDTEGVALAGLVDVLQQFGREYKALGEAVGNNLDKLNSLSSQSENLAEAVKELLRQLETPMENAADIPAEGSGDSQEAPPPDMGTEMPPDMGTEMPPDMGAEMPPDMGGGMPPDMGGGMPPDMGAEMPVGAGMPAGTPTGPISDEDMKNVKRGVLSDARLKRTARGMVGEWKRSRARAKSQTPLSSNIIGACREVGDA